MSSKKPTCDGDLLDLLRAKGPLGVAKISKAIRVTATAIRQRLMRLMGQGLIEREAVRAGRGRPKHLYRLTESGMRLTGSNFTDLALALWKEVSKLEDQAVREELVVKVAKALAAQYAGQIQGSTTYERMRSLGELLAQRRIPVSVEDLAKAVVMTAHACPYPDLAEEDRDVCNMEKKLFSELLERQIELIRCRLDGGQDCQFEAEDPQGPHPG